MYTDVATSGVSGRVLERRQQAGREVRSNPACGQSLDATTMYSVFAGRAPRS